MPKPTLNTETIKKNSGMNFVQKIFYNDKPLILTTNKATYIKTNPEAKTFSYFSGASAHNYTQALRQLERAGIIGALIEDASPGTLLSQLHTMYRSIDAGGGVAYNEQGAILMIFRRGKWDLPKGKLDDGEKIDECALREVSEETGLKHLKLAEKICDTYHIYSQNNEQLLKRTAWYKMEGTSADKLKPQKEENILEAKWVSEKDLGPLADKSYEAIRDVLRASGLKWQ
jgi:8-oxo-dGTP pyrophosphatase MutT (NUDIX family)